jgi:cysteinyl-tRNA synthetase
VYSEEIKIDKDNLEKLIKLYNTFVYDILGLVNEEKENSENSISGDLIDMLLNIRMEAKANKNFELSDKIRNQLAEKGVVVRDKKDGFEWEIKN